MSQKCQEVAIFRPSSNTLRERLLSASAQNNIQISPEI